MKSRSNYVTGLACTLLLTAATCRLQAATVTVPNASFEAPPTTFAWPQIDYWQQVPQPDLSDQRTQLTGVFSNTPPAIDNCDGGQAAFLFAVPYVSIFQDYTSTDYARTNPLQAFTTTFDPGKSYTLTVAVLGGTNLAIPMYEGTTLELSLYYRDPASNMLTVAATTITNRGSLFPSATHFVDFQVQTPIVKPSDPWAGRPIGIRILSTVDYQLANGYWDLDNVRLVSTVAPVLMAPAYTNSHFSFTLQSEPGLAFDILASTNLTLPLSNWTSLGMLTNVTGATAFTDTASSLSRRFYRARQLP